MSDRTAGDLDEIVLKAFPCSCDEAWTLRGKHEVGSLCYWRPAITDFAEDLIKAVQDDCIAECERMVKLQEEHGNPIAAVWGAISCVKALRTSRRS